MKNWISILFLLLFGFLPLQSLSAEGRTKNLEFIILLDKSLSMVDKIEDVKTFFKTQVLEKSVIPGDQVMIVIFYGKAELLLKNTIQGPKDIQEIETSLDAIHGDGPFTDIGNAIDVTYDLIQKEPGDSPRRHFILLTDGRQEAPAGSKYESLDFSIKHPFLESAKNIQQKGWKVQILGIGTDTEAQNLADELSGTSKIWSDSQSMLLEKELNFEEELLMKNSPWLSFHDGVPILNLAVDSFGMNRSSTLAIKQILAFENDQKIPYPLLNKSIKVAIPSNQLLTLEIPLEKHISPISLEHAVFVVQYEGDLSIQPSRFSAPSGWLFLQKEWPLSVLGVLALLALVFIMLTRWKVLSLRSKLRLSQRKMVVF